MLEGKGYYKGSSILVSGGPGTGKTSIGAHFAFAAAARGDRCLYWTFEESESQLVRNMRTIGIDLRPAIEEGRLIVSAVRPTTYGLEMHLARMLHTVQEIKPGVIVVDPLSALQASGSTGQSGIMVLRLIDFLKSAGATALYLNVQDSEDKTDLNISSLMDTWIMIRNTRRETGLERRLHIVNQARPPTMNHRTNHPLATAGICASTSLGRPTNRSGQSTTSPASARSISTAVIRSR